MPGTGAIILAAGESKRFGQPKQLVQLEGVPLVRRIADHARDAGCSPVIVVVGSEDQPGASEVEGAAGLGGDTLIIVNEAWRSGIGSSIRAGVQLAATMPEVDGIILMVCDQPAVDHAILKKLISTRKQSARDIVACAYAGTMGVPTLFTRACFRELLQLPNDQGGKSIILREPERVTTVSFEQGSLDIDTREDWDAFSKSV